MTIQKICICLSSLFFISSGCDRFKETFPTREEVTDSKEISMESVIERMWNNDKKSLEESDKRGDTDVVGLVDGKKWSENSFDRYDHIRGITDIVSSSRGIASVILEESNEQEKQRAKATQKNQSTIAAARAAIGYFLLRIGDVTDGRSFGDIINAVDKFYNEKPLLKDRPVIWVLAVPLYQQLQEAKPPEQRDNPDTVTVPTFKQKGKTS